MCRYTTTILTLSFVLSSFCLVLFTFVSLVFYKKYKSHTKLINTNTYPTKRIVVMFIYFSLVMCLVAYSLILLSLMVSLPYSIFFMLALTPLCLVMIYIPLDVAGIAYDTTNASVRFRKYNEFIVPFVFAVCISFSVTYFSFFIGNVANPEVPVPQTFSMLLSNALFDGLTMVATISILKWAVDGKGVFRIPLAISIDTLLCALLACGSLYFGLYSSENRLSIQEVVLVLVARAPNNAGFELGPYFWAMHTTFLPTLFYLSFILFVWVSSCFLQPVTWLFGVGQTHKNPLKLTAGVLAFISSLFFAMSYGTGLFEEYVRKKQLQSAPDKQIQQPRDTNI